MPFLSLPLRKAPKTNYILASKFKGGEWYVRSFGNKLMDFTVVQRFAMRFDLYTAVTLQAIFAQRGHSIYLVALQGDRLFPHELLPGDLLGKQPRPQLPEE